MIPKLRDEEVSNSLVESFNRIRNRIENLSSSMTTWKQLEDGLSDFKVILDRDRGKLQGIEGALQSGAGRTDEMVNSVKEVVKALSEKAEPLFQVNSFRFY